MRIYVEIFRVYDMTWLRTILYYTILYYTVLRTYVSNDDFMGSNKGQNGKDRWIKLKDTIGNVNFIVQLEKV